MKLSQRPVPSLETDLAGPGLMLEVGGFNVRITSSVESVVRGLPRLYADYAVRDPVQSIVDFDISLNPPSLVRRWLRPQIQFLLDGFSPFKPLPREQGFALFEWGLNWCIANHSHRYLVIHAAVVERDGRAFIFPGAPGSGKSTLCAALVCRGWRLLSDEMAMVSLESGLVRPVPRPISLKNESIDIIRRFDANATFGDAVRDTAKGTVGHMKPPAASIARAAEHARGHRIVFPRYRADAACDVRRLTAGETFMRVASNTFNYHVLGRAGFDALGDLLACCAGVSLEYASFADAFEVIEALENEL